MDWLSYLQGLGIFLFILSFIPLGAQLYKKYQIRENSSSFIKVLEIKPLSYKAQLLLVEIEGKRYLLALTDKGITNLGEINHG